MLIPSKQKRGHERMVEDNPDKIEIIEDNRK